MERTDYLIYGTHVDTPGDETLLCVVDDVNKAKFAVIAYKVSGNWTEVHYECREVN